MLVRPWGCTASVPGELRRAGMLEAQRSRTLARDRAAAPSQSSSVHEAEAGLDWLGEAAHREVLNGSGLTPEAPRATS